MNTEGMEQGSNHTLDNMAKLDLTRQYLKKKKKKKAAHFRKNLFTINLYRKIGREKYRMQKGKLKHNTSAHKHGGSIIMAPACMAANGTVTSVYG